MSFGEYVKAGGFIQKTIPGTTIIVSKQSNRHQQVNQLTKPMKNNSRRGLEASIRGWGPTYHWDRLAGPTYRLASLWVHMSSSPFYVDFPPPLRVHLSVAQGRFIQWWSRELTRINDVAMLCSLLHLPYIRHPLPPPMASLIQIKIHHKREISTKLSRCRSRIVRLRVRESCSGSGEIFEGRVYLCILPLQDLCYNIVIFSIYFYTFHVYG
jgi:hypothetical protein